MVGAATTLSAMARRLTAALAALLCGVVVLAFVAAGRAGDGPAMLVVPAAPAAAAPETGPSAVQRLYAPWLYKSQELLPPQLFTAADAVVPDVALYSGPGAPAASGSLSNPTREGVPLTFLVRAQQADWLQVQIPARPNGAMAWVRAADVQERMIANHIVVEVGGRRLTAFDPEGNVLLQEPVGIGQDRYPTPVGEFYVDAHFDNPGGAYGVYMLSVAGFSDVLETFGGGVGQIAIHGTNQPQLIGGKISHGCIRMTNDSITRLKAFAPTGTPVSVVP